MITQASIDNLANEYWRTRWQPGETTEDDQGHVQHGPKSKAIWNEMTDLLERRATEQRRRLAEFGVPEVLLNLPLGVTGDWEGKAQRVLWRGTTRFDVFELGHELEHKLDGFVDHPEWSDGGFVATWVNEDLRAVVTYAEHDVSIVWAFNREAFLHELAEVAAFWQSRSA